MRRTTARATSRQSTTSEGISQAPPSAAPTAAITRPSSTITICRSTGRTRSVREIERSVVAAGAFCPGVPEG